jgi:NitT/TauT family transport system ATP-binding protein
LHVLDNISFNINKGEFVCVVGPTGCGKTTFLNLLTRIYMPTKGDLYIDGESADPKKHNLAFVFQEPSAMPWLTVEKNLRFGLEIKKLSKQVIAERVEKIISLLGAGAVPQVLPSPALCQHRAADHHWPRLRHEPRPAADGRAVRADGYQAALLPRRRGDRLWKELGSTVIFITHNIEEAVYLAERILILTNKPATIREQVVVNLPRPRDVTSPAFVAVRKHVTDQIKWW